MKKEDILYIIRLRNKALSKQKIRQSVSKERGISYSQTNRILSKVNPDKHLFSLSQNQFKRLYTYGNNLESMAKYLTVKTGQKVTVLALRDVAHKNKIKRDSSTRKPPGNQLYDSEMEKQICSGYKEGLSAQQLADKFGFKSKRSILVILKNNGVKSRTKTQIRNAKISYADFSFEKIDSPEKAYFLGLLLTDGYVIKSRGYVGIDLVDKDAIELISKITNQKYNVIPTDNENHKDKYRIILYGKDYLEQLERLGVTPNKTFTTNGSQLNESEKELFRYILRGIIDGDGWVRKDGKEFFISSASSGFMDWVLKEMENMGFTNLKINKYENEHSGYYLIRTASKDNLKLLREVVYQEPLGMARKYKRLHQDGRSETIIRGTA
ncbi:hypothetical protein JMA_42810 (plasmid) [Jeotgalibacillus malaysiensis]|uniref:DOD-type homing endonuclease domain-containing protein n=1 Tax=Jeotgalibacillus malaysiensis TaxID=1508404 RepID=A0A0B5AYK7_9BACL|nr:LAGLIDADG family homing endonuclease [Jeotgalibacillus malaysiensis]AJD93598.1 hypothetical protein JMA_42810 [Jeotgalibacillus malaysiensis]